MAEITLGKALKIKDRLTGRLAKVQAEVQVQDSSLPCLLCSLSAVPFMQPPPG
jgi:hypothetical protein